MKRNFGSEPMRYGVYDTQSPRLSTNVDWAGPRPLPLMADPHCERHSFCREECLNCQEAKAKSLQIGNDDAIDR
jgi:hypothetical protein